MQLRSIQGSLLYCSHFVNDYSRHGAVYYLKSKDQCAIAFKRFLAWAENQTSERLSSSALWIVEGSTVSREVRSILDLKGIEHKIKHTLLATAKWTSREMESYSP